MSDSESKESPTPMVLSIECTVCFELYEERGSRSPSILSCGHSVCESCMTAILTSGRTPKCPTCRALILKNPVKNYAMCELLAAIKRAHGIVDDAVVPHTDEVHEDHPIGAEYRKLLEQEEATCRAANTSSSATAHVPISDDDGDESPRRESDSVFVDTSSVASTRILTEELEHREAAAAALRASHGTNPQRSGSQHLASSVGRWQRLNGRWVDTQNPEEYQQNPLPTEGVGVTTGTGTGAGADISHNALLEMNDGSQGQRDRFAVANDLWHSRHGVAPRPAPVAARRPGRGNPRAPVGEERQALSHRMFERVSITHPQYARRITDVMLDLDRGTTVML